MTGRLSFSRLVPYGRALRNVVPFAMVVFVAAEWNGIPGQSVRDTAAYHDAAERVREGEPLYADLPAPGPHEFVRRWPYLYPPPLAAAVSLLPPTSYRTFDRMWLLLSLAAFWAFAASLGRLHSGRWSWKATGTWGAALFLVPGSLLAIHFGNAETVIWALVGLAFAMALPVTGFLLAAAAALKVTPVWALLGLSFRRPRSILPGAAMAALFLAALCLAVFGASGTLELVTTWRTRIVPTLAQGQFWGGSLADLRYGPGLRGIMGNLSLSFAPVQIAVLAGWGYDGGPLPDPVRAYLFVAGVAIPLATLWATRRLGPREQAAWVLVAAVLAAPIVRPYVLPLALLPAALRLAPSREPDEDRRAHPGHLLPHGDA